MFERFTDRARRVLVLAQEEARLLNHNFLGTEHLLLGLIHEADGVGAKALEALGVDLDATRGQVLEAIKPGTAPFTGAPPFTPRSKRVLELSLREALELGHNYIGTEHLLLGLIREGEGVGPQLLVKNGVPLEGVRSKVLELLSGMPHPVTDPTPAARRVSSRASALAGGAGVQPNTGHYLRALLESGDSVAAIALAEFGVTLEAVTARLRELEEQGVRDAGEPSARVTFTGGGQTITIASAEVVRRLRQLEETGVDVGRAVTEALKVYDPGQPDGGDEPPA